jgi:Domain of unknown function (DUF5666)
MSLRRFAPWMLFFAAVAAHAAPVTVTGAIEAIAIPSIVVNGTTIALDAQSVISNGCVAVGFASLTVGEVVTVEGQSQADGSILAASVAHGPCAVSGPIAAIALDGIVVGGVSFEVDALTVVSAGCVPVPLSSLKVGQVVAVDGIVRADASVLALSILAQGLCTFSGQVAAIAVPDLVVAGRTVHVDASTTIALGCATGSLADLSVGDTVSIVGDALPDLSVIAHSVTRGACNSLASFFAEVEASGRKIEVSGAFSLGNGSNGIDPATERVSLQAGAFSVTIAPGSFRKKSGSWKFEGVVGTKQVEAEIRSVGVSAYEFSVEVEGSGLPPLAPPVIVTLTIGDDRGSGAARLKH